MTRPAPGTPQDGGIGRASCSRRWRPREGLATYRVVMLDGAYGRAKAGQLAEQARRRYQGSVQRTTATVIVR